MTPEVEEAISELEEAFSGHAVEVTPDTQGGAYVVIQDLPLGSQYKPERAWVGFLIGFQYPSADVYPLFTEPTLARVDGAPLGVGFQQPIDWNGRKSTQISRRSNALNPAEDTALLKLLKVLEWLAVQ